VAAVSAGAGQVGDVCIFARPPRPGGAKTRLIPAVGEVGAATLAGAFFADTWEAVSALRWLRPVLATTELPGPGASLGPAGAVWRQGEVWLQGEGDLGARLERILTRALARGPWALALGADSPGLPLQRLEEARAALATHDAVLGPADDGGYYLLGLTRCPQGLLAGLPWSAPTTLAATRARLEERGLTVALLPPWLDVDVPEDLARLAGLLLRGEAHAPHTARVLASLGRMGEGGGA
jgi:rSAM/selenodomain-associated transferase 1